MKNRIAVAIGLLAAAGFALAQTPHGTLPAATAPVGKIEKARGADGRTVADVIANKSALKGRNVTIRGQVVKVSNGVLGRNWVHLQDGSGSREKGTNDIIVTTNDEAAVGQVVDASGIVRTDVDIGSGYKYAVLVEDAKLRR